MSARGYLALMRLFAPILVWLAQRRHRAMGAAEGRFAERLGQGGDGARVLWITAASLGEVRAAQALIAQLGARCTDLPILLTTTTQSAANRAELSCAHVDHRFQPLDTPAAVDAFLRSWSPAYAVFIENEAPLRMIEALVERGVPLALVNVRPSKTRARLPSAFQAFLPHVSIATTQDDQTAAELIDLTLAPEALKGVVDLKSLAPAPAPDPAALTELTGAVDGRPVILFLSLHPSEAPFVAQIATLPAQIIVLPRHPEKAAEFEAALTPLETSRRSAGFVPDADTVYLADTFGEVGTFLALADIVVMGGTFAEIGGHGPQEALAAGRSVLHGPHTGNATAAYRAASEVGAARMASSATELASQCATLLKDPTAFNARAEQVQPWGSDVLDSLVSTIADHVRGR
ncbi:MAG: glycosyltransferase N-terminal domain-containing protein [Pseudomonadota bacterium]